MDIIDKVVIVTGASSGIGEAGARLLAAEGARVALAARSREKLETLAAELPDSFSIPVDMTDEASIKSMVAEVVKHYGRIDVLVNNAGRGSAWLPIEKVDVDDYRSLVELNVFGPILAMQEVIPIMRKQGGGAIVNIGSGTVHLVREGGGLYPGTKILLSHITRVARKELEKDGITVSLLHPYITATNFFTNIATNRDEPLVASPGLLDTADSAEKVAQAMVEIIRSGADEVSLALPRLQALL
ncbi:MAG: SDR family NAD(P)-dependent oxidoreductase [Capsulimonadaceae bacterium]|nr:SDR family NAD(P)-dependent oxidoreductase [Capsulimonadaceae bacterium]